MDIQRRAGAGTTVDVPTVDGPDSPSVLARLDGAIGHVTLNRPGRTNALDPQLAAELARALRDLSPAANAILIRGAGGNFCAGADLKLMRESRHSKDAMRAFVEQVGAAVNLFAALPIPVVAVLEGYCLAGGFEIMQACDFALAAESAVIGDVHANFSQLPGAGGTVRIPRWIGRQHALGLLLTGDRFSGAEAKARGLIYDAYPDDEFEQRVADLAATLARHDRAELIALKRAVIDLAELPMAEALARERELFIEHVTGPTGRAGLDRFLNRKG
jgi:enoyl-CoA hydratase/carnithine racemase